MFLFRALVLFGLISIFSAASFACVCADMDFSDSEAKAYYNERKFTGAIFTGKIINIRELSEREDVGDGMSFPLRELEVDVEQYWFGIEKSKLKLLTLGPNTSCSVEWEKNRSLFFIASKTERGLSVGSCDLTNWKGNYPDEEWADYTRRILGPAKAFKKITNSKLNN